MLMLSEYLSVAGGMLEAASEESYGHMTPRKG